MSDRTIDLLNEVAKPLLYGGVFVVDESRKLKVWIEPARRPARSMPPFLTVCLRSDRKWFRHRNIAHILSLGGTDEQTLCQLVLWWRDLPRLPGRVLACWQGREFARRLARVGYDDDKSSRCVLCGGDFSGLDWWSRGKITGPCCSFGGKCREKAGAT